MVKHRKVILLFLAVLCASSCENNILGLFGSTELNERLNDANNFTYLDGSVPPANSRSLSLNNAGGDYSFVVVSDTHMSDGDAFGLDNLHTKLINTDKFVIDTGDITEGAKAVDVQRFIDIAGNMKIPASEDPTTPLIPFYPVIGNHDIYFGNWPNWREKIGSTRYRVWSGNPGDHALFILDSANITFGKAQLQWLESGLNEVKAAGGRAFVFTHANMFISKLLDIEHLTDARERAWFMSILAGKAEIAFSGHVHDHIERRAGGVLYISLHKAQQKREACRVTVRASGGYSLSFFNY
jgi:hypothetical protein